MKQAPVDLSDVLAFVRVVETGSFGRAAERLGLSKSLLSRRVARLEEGLGARLLTRTARGAQATAVGQAYYGRLSNVLASLEAAHEEVAEAVSEIAGSIRITAPHTFGVRYLGPLLAEFMLAHPRVAVDLSLDDRRVDLVGGGFDLAVRVASAALPDSSLMARRLTRARHVVVASPAYLERHGTPRHPRDLADHSVLHYANVGSDQWRFLVNGRPEVIRVRGRLRADNGEVLCSAAVAGLGIGIFPTFIASPGLQSGELKVILDEFSLEDGTIFAVMPPGRALTARVRALVDFLAERMGPEPTWDPCWLAAQAAARKGTAPAEAAPALQAAL
ncbi:LysR family transcriptional regulator [Zavarzinia sp. CC-PAN008]|uniref:LysR family transcriptional regulator n=1 Tax=Zavarzinia sp. CC-PAN008 TaxID=3243332 RepID=UPI003F74296A